MPNVSIELSDFAYAALDGEASRQDVHIEDVITHAAMYYLADLDSGRLSAKPLKLPATEAPTPLSTHSETVGRASWASLA